MDQKQHPTIRDVSIQYRAFYTNVILLSLWQRFMYWARNKTRVLKCENVLAKCVGMGHGRPVSRVTCHMRYIGYVPIRNGSHIWV